MDFFDFSLSWPTSPDMKQFEVYFAFTEDRGDVDFEGFAEYHRGPGPCLTILRPPDGPSDPCLATLTCAQRSGVTIRAVEVESESRTLELFEATRGYLQTVRGKPLDSPGQDRGDNPPQLYQCQCLLEEPVQQLSFKFLSLGERPSFKLTRMFLVLANGAPGFGELGDRDGVLSGRLRRHVEGLGDQVSDRALSFLDTLEQYKKNKCGAMTGMQQMLTQSGLPPAQQTSFAGMLSAFSRLSTPPPAPQASSGSQTSSTPQASSTHAQPLPPMVALLSQLGAGGLGGAGRGAGDGAERGASGGAGSSEAFSLMQSICSQVTKMRSNPPPTPPSVNNTSGSAERDAGVESLVDTKMKEAEKRVMAHVDARIQDVETKLSSKLDAVMSLLQGLSAGQRVSTPQSSPDSGSQSLPDFDAAGNRVNCLEDTAPPAQNGHSSEDSAGVNGHGDSSPVDDE